MFENDKLINKFYKQYKQLHNKIEETTNKNQVTVSNMINSEIINGFIKSKEMEKYSSIFINYKNKNKNEISQKIENVLGNYQWSITDNSINTLNPDILGNVFEKYINQKESGSYYTSDDTIEFILNTVLYKYLYYEIFPKVSGKKARKYHNSQDIKEHFWNEINCLNNEEIKALIDDFSKLKIGDISVGTGAFLVVLIDKLYNITKLLYKKSGLTVPKKQILLNILENNIYGIDIMDDAVEMCDFRIKLKAVQIMNREDFIIEEFPKLNAYVANTLLLTNLDDIMTFDDDEKLFDIIIGNPPYIEKSKVKNYKVENLTTIKAGNTYAFMIEKSLHLLAHTGMIGLIVPISLVSTKRMKVVRELLYDNCDEIYFANFADRPGTLFNGVHQKLTVLFANKNYFSDPKIFTTNYKHWYENERKELFDNVNFYENDVPQQNFIPKIGNHIENEIIKKISTNDYNLLNLTDNNGDEKLFLNMRITFWVKSFLYGNNSSEYKQWNFKTENERNIFYLIINSDIFFFLWEVFSDGWHITNKELENIYIISRNIKFLDEKKVSELVSKLEKDLETNKEYIGSKQIEYVYKHKKSKIIIDEINSLIGYLFGLNKEELKYIQNYNLKYRMNDELNRYLLLKEVEI